MTTSDHGHANNLDEDQIKTLKTYWIALLSAIDKDPTRVFDSTMGNELFYLFGTTNPDVVLLRWLRARKWQVSIAVQFMIDTLKWRHEWGVQRLLEEGESALIKEECASAKVYPMGTDRVGRPVSYIHAKEHIKGEYPIEATEKLVIFFTETTRLMIEPSREEATVVMDMLDIGLQNLDYQHIKFMITVMQNYYPESLGLGLVVNAPWAFNVVWNVIKSWLDPVVASKIHFVRSSKELAEYIDPSNIPKRLEGERTDFKYIAPTQEDENRIKLFRNDVTGMQKLRLEYKEAAQNYIDVTLKWATTESSHDDEEKLNRTNAATRLSMAFQQLLPYVSTETHFHRTGDIQEPIFDITYNRLCMNENEQNTSLVE